MKKAFYKKLELSVGGPIIALAHATHESDCPITAIVELRLEEYLSRHQPAQGEAAYMTRLSTTHHWSGLLTPDHADPRNLQMLPIAAGHGKVAGIFDYPHSLLRECVHILGREGRDVSVDAVMREFASHLEHNVGVGCRQVIAHGWANDFGLDKGYLELEVRFMPYRYSGREIIDC